MAPTSLRLPFPPTVLRPQTCHLRLSAPMVREVAYQAIRRHDPLLSYHHTLSCIRQLELRRRLRNWPIILPTSTRRFLPIQMRRGARSGSWAVGPARAVQTMMTSPRLGVRAKLIPIQTRDHLLVPAREAHRPSPPRVLPEAMGTLVPSKCRVKLSAQTDSTIFLVSVLRLFVLLCN